MANNKQGNEPIVIRRPNLKTVIFEIVGTAPYVQHKFSQKARNTIMETQSGGQRSKSKSQREPKDFEQLYKDAMHISTDGWHGIPAPAFRSAMISACRVAGYVMTKAKLAVFVLPDGFDKDDASPLVKIEGEPEMHVGHARNETGVVDIRSRPMWREWEAAVKVQFDANMLSTQDVANLLQTAGLQVGIGEGRPDSKKSHGCGWGTFELKGQSPTINGKRGNGRQS